jgi:alpha-L-arabinofuranosidase
LANKLSVPVVDEHYYEEPKWFLNNTHRYDNYDRSHSKVYIGEYASRGNTLFNALSEAVYMTSIERNGDVVQMASYAPLLAKISNISWHPDMIFFTNTKVVQSVNYYVQQLFSTNQGDMFFSNVLSSNGQDSTLGLSCVKDSKTGDLILKIANAGATAKTVTANLKKLGVSKSTVAKQQSLSGKPYEENTIADAQRVIPIESELTVSNDFSYDAPAYSLTVFRIKTGSVKP